MYNCTKNALLLTFSADVQPLADNENNMFPALPAPLFFGCES